MLWAVVGRAAGLEWPVKLKHMAGRAGYQEATRLQDALPALLTPALLAAFFFPSIKQGLCNVCLYFLLLLSLLDDFWKWLNSRMPLGSVGCQWSLWDLCMRALQGQSMETTNPDPTEGIAAHNEGKTFILRQDLSAQPSPS